VNFAAASDGGDKWRLESAAKFPYLAESNFEGSSHFLPGHIA
jgi:hypothetical protein